MKVSRVNIQANEGVREVRKDKEVKLEDVYVESILNKCEYIGIYVYVHIYVTIIEEKLMNWRGNASEDWGEKEVRDYLKYGAHI